MNLVMMNRLTSIQYALMLLSANSECRKGLVEEHGHIAGCALAWAEDFFFVF